MFPIYIYIYIYRYKTRREHGRERYKNPSQDKKQKLAQYRKKDYRMRKNALS